jgi:two-component sensor histidine kinase
MCGVMSHTTTGTDRSLLHVAEFQHRVNNEYAKLISFVSRLAALSSAPEIKAALLKVVDHLNASAKIHRALRPPLPGEMERGISLQLSIKGSVVLDAIRSWHANLIIAELLTNSVRHACLEGEGRICVAVETDDVNIVCRISDDGAPPATVARRGVGSRLVDALIDELRGHISRSYMKIGAIITLRFPMNPEGQRRVTEPDRYR